VLDLSINLFFRNVSLFAGLDGTELSVLLRHVQPFVKEPGVALFEQGDEGDGMYVIERGEVGVFVRREGPDRVLLAELGNGAIIGELSLIDGSPRSATVETVSMARGYFLPRARFDELRSRWDLGAHKVVLQLARTLEQRRRVTEQRLRSLVDSGSSSGVVGTGEFEELFGRLLKG